jgi:hypothetical protein
LTRRPDNGQKWPADFRRQKTAVKTGGDRRRQAPAAGIAAAFARRRPLSPLSTASWCRAVGKKTLGGDKYSVMLMEYC